MALTPVMYFKRAEKFKEQSLVANVVAHHLDVSPFELQDAVIEMFGIGMLAVYPNRILPSSCDGCQVICPAAATTLQGGR